MQNGGCHPVDRCLGPHPFPGAKFHYLAASTVVKDSGKTLFPPYEIKSFDGIPVAFIGLTLKGTPGLISPASAAGLEFRDEAETVNALVPELKAKGVEAIVVLIHEGGQPTGDYNECPGISGPIVDIVKKFDRAIDIVVSGHTHQAYVCNIDGRLVTSGDKYGTLVTAIDVKLDRSTRDVISARADNVIVRTSIASDPAQAALLRSLRQGRRPHRQPPRRLGHGNAVARAQPDRRERARRRRRGCAARRDARRGQGRRRDRHDQPRRHPHRYREEGRRHGELCRRVCEPAVPQPARSR